MIVPWRLDEEGSFLGGYKELDVGLIEREHKAKEPSIYHRRCVETRSTNRPVGFSLKLAGFEGMYHMLHTPT